MLAAMSLRRLPLFRPADLGASAVEVTPRVLSGRAVVVADTADGEPSLRWAAGLARELWGLGRSVEVCVVGAAPGLSAEGSFTAQFPAGVALRELALSGLHEVSAALVGASSLWLAAGPAALQAFSGGLSVLVGADAPLLRWPEEVRRARARVSLELAGDGLDVARALAQRLSEG